MFKHIWPKTEVTYNVIRKYCMIARQYILRSRRVFFRFFFFGGGGGVGGGVRGYSGCRKPARRENRRLSFPPLQYFLFVFNTAYAAPHIFYIAMHRSKNKDGDMYILP